MTRRKPIARIYGKRQTVTLQSGLGGAYEGEYDYGLEACHDHELRRFGGGLGAVLEMIGSGSRSSVALEVLFKPVTVIHRDSLWEG